jgi:hypothetical protein
MRPAGCASVLRTGLISITAATARTHTSNSTTPVRVAGQLMDQFAFPAQGGARRMAVG